MTTPEIARLELMLEQAREIINDLRDINRVEREQMWEQGYEFGYAHGHQAGYDASERDMAEHWATLARKTLPGAIRAIDRYNATTFGRLQRELAETRRALWLTALNAAHAQNAELAPTVPQLERRDHAGLVRPTDSRAA